MKLSVIIVNYNVAYFLEQCLLSVFKAIDSIESEVFVVDNNSVDGSVEMVREKFPQVQLIANKDNPGFSIANNQAIRLSKGEYVLLLNPDTVVQENTFTKCVDYMDTHTDVGGLGVRMIDGKGNFLPESKRGLPTPWVSFYKIFGLTKLFPKSKKFGQYQLTYLPENETNEVDVLSGAYMFMRKEVLDKVGLLDEQFFMYGEDIDLSYRIQLGGSKNVYFPETSIIHYKGESTKKGSVNYVLVFYKAMEIFAKKHFKGKYSALILGVIQLAIYLRMTLAILSRVYRKIQIPFLDLLVFSGIGYGLIFGYFNLNEQPSQEPWFVFIPLIYGIFCSLGFLMLGNNKSPIRIKKPIKDGLLLAVGLLLVYNFLPESFRFSRFGSFLLAATIPFVGWILRWVYSKLLVWFDLESKSSKNVVLVGDPHETDRIRSVLETTSIKHKVFLSQTLEELKNRDVEELIAVGRIHEFIFSGESISSEAIIDFMGKIRHTQVDFKISPSNSVFIIGSNSINENGELYSMDINALNRTANKRKKRLFDIGASCLCLLMVPFLLWTKKGNALLRSSFKVLGGNYSWIGFFQEDPKLDVLPHIKKGIFGPKKRQASSSGNWYTQSNRLYAREYSLLGDFEIWLNHLF